MSQTVRRKLADLAHLHGLSIEGGSIRRTSSRFCLGVEHGDYNGTELFGVGADRFMWLAYKPNTSGQIRLFHANLPDDGLITFKPGNVPPPRSTELEHSWGRFPCGVDYILRERGYPINHGFDGVVYGNIPGGGMSRSASITINLLLTFFEVNGLTPQYDMEIVDLAQAVENEYIGSPCGKLDQIMIYFAKEGKGTHYNPRTGEVDYIPFGADTDELRLVSLDTGTDRPGLEKSTYKVRRQECDEMVEIIGEEFRVSSLGDVRDETTYRRILDKYGDTYPRHCARLTYIYNAQQRFYQMLDAWRRGDTAEIGKVFREDGRGLRDVYDISGPELETMCDIARTVPGVLGERMLGGGDKGAAGAIVDADSVEKLLETVDIAYPRSYPERAEDYAVHACKMVDGVQVLPGI